MRKRWPWSDILFGTEELLGGPTCGGSEIGKKLTKAALSIAPGKKGFGGALCDALSLIKCPGFELGRVKVRARRE
jgi:hypothetical protein